VATSNASQKQTVEMALKATELFYTNIFEQSAKADGAKAKPKPAAKAAPAPATKKKR